MMPEPTESILDRKLAEFSQLIETGSWSDLRQYQETFPTKLIYADSKEHVPLFFHRQWIKTSVRGHLRTLNRIVRASSEQTDTTKRQLAAALAWLGQASRIYTYVRFFDSLAERELSQFLLSETEVTTGDIVVSYKTPEFLKHSRLSWLVKFTTNSPITHVMIVVRHPGEKPQFLFSGDATKGLGLIPIATTPGEILLVLRPSDSIKDALLTNITHWEEQAIRAKQRQQFPFPELKCQTASIIGLITVVFGFLGQPLALSNPFKNRPGMFCSELIDTLFSDIGVLLTPRSINKATVGPIEIFYSPHLKLQGVLCHASDIEHLHQQIVRQFKSY